MNEKYLIINADDFGSSYGANEAIEILFNGGYITSTTLMTPCTWAEDAIIRIKNNNKIKVGLHTTLTSEWKNNKWSAVSREDISSLLNTDGYFYPTVPEFAKNATSNAVINELEAQYNYMISRGIVPTHADNHMGTLYGLVGKSFLVEAIDFCSKHNLPFRLPRNVENFGKIPAELAEFQSQLDGFVKSKNVPIIDTLLSYYLPVIENDSYEIIKKNYIDIIKNIQPGINEIYLHPMVDTPDGRAAVPTWQMRNWEFLVLQDKDFTNAIKDNNIKLIGWNKVRELN